MRTNRPPTRPAVPAPKDGVDRRRRRRIDVEVVGGIVSLHVTGRLDVNLSKDILGLVASAREAGADGVVVDLEAVWSSTREGTTALIPCLATARRFSKGLRIIADTSLLAALAQ
jgi:hypothetical protein